MTPRKTTLRDFVPNDEKLFLAMQTFLLGDPQRQLIVLGSIDSLMSRARQDIEKGDFFDARLSYETAAKLEIYNQNRESVEKYLRLAFELTKEGEPKRDVLQTMMGKLDEVMQISRLYYAPLIPKS